MNASLDEARQLLKAGERDRTSFLLLLETGKAPHETLGFLAQQACEKFLKSVMVLHAIGIARTHDLEYLVELADAGGLIVPVPGQQLRRLNPYAVAFRYESAEREWLRAADASTMVDTLHRWAQDAISGQTGVSVIEHRALRYLQPLLRSALPR